MGKIFFTADNHFGHKNAIKYCNRPFKDVNHMNEVMITQWNSVVQQNDHVYHLGDICFCDRINTSRILKRLNGKIYLIKGNHDKRVLKEGFRERFEWIKDYHELTVQEDKQLIVLCHYAFKVWKRSHFGSWHLYGHSHGNLPDDGKSLSFDVGVDCNNFTPLSYQQVKKIIELRRKK